jgi:L-ascorbate metabolism protein UlaG (beta-lactamase superfamily)
MSAGAWHAPSPAHFDGKRFYNPDHPQARGFLDVLRWKLTTHPERSPAWIADVITSVPPRLVETGQLRVTAINHSTVLLQQPGITILTDPIWSHRASPIGWAGPKRRRAPGVRFEDLPEIDIVLLSHNHYDHLDVSTIRKLALRRIEFVVSLGVASLIKKQGATVVHELDWDQSVKIGGIIIHCVPALHFSARGPFDRNRTLWCGYVIETGDGLVYFAGDTAFGDHFGAIHARFGPARLALLPIGAYQPRWFMSAVHMGPDEAIRAHDLLGAKKSVAIHHGTFQLTDEEIDKPRQELAEGLSRRHEGPHSFLTLANGSSVLIP